jgi:hypothetical protein
VLLLLPLIIIVVSNDMWYSGQSSWLQIQRSEFDSRRYQNGTGFTQPREYN